MNTANPNPAWPSPPATVRCEFYLRTPAREDPDTPAAPEAYAYTRLWLESYGGHGSLDLPEAPAAGDHIQLTENRPEGIQGNFTVLGRDWTPRVYGTPSWGYGTPQPTSGPTVTILVERAQASLFLNEAPGTPATEQGEADELAERAGAQARAVLLAEVAYDAYRRVAGDVTTPTWRELTTSLHRGNQRHQETRRGWIEAAAATYTALARDHLDPGTWAATAVDHDVIDDDGVYVGLDREIMDIAETAELAGYPEHAVALRNSAAYLRESWRGNDGEPGDGLAEHVATFRDHLDGLIENLRDLHTQRQADSSEPTGGADRG